MLLFSKLNDVPLFKLIETDYSVLLSNEAYYFIPICHFKIIEKHLGRFFVLMSKRFKTTHIATQLLYDTITKNI